LGHWRVLDDTKAVMTLGRETDEFQMRYIPDQQLEVRFLAGREVYERATPEQVSVTHLRLVSGVDFNDRIRSYLEYGVTTNG